MLERRLWEWRAAQASRCELHQRFININRKIED